MKELQTVLIVPSLNPEEKLPKVVKDAVDVGFPAIILVDDGSDQDHKRHFEDLREQYPQVVVLTHPVNLGKGEALKTAFRYFAETYAQTYAGAVTADGDGQHSMDDIVRCVEEMQKSRAVVLGCRDFSLPDVPFRSRIGNNGTTVAFRWLCGRKVSDTQTGLRAFPREYIGAMLEIEGSRFEYEINMIFEMNRLHIPIAEVPIQTIYEENNSCSHFRPIPDTVRIYGLIAKYVWKHHCGFKYILSSLLSWLLDIGVNELLLIAITFVCRNYNVTDLVVGSVVTGALPTARAVSSLFNFTVNRKYVFRSKEPIGKTLVKYYVLYIPQALVNAYLIPTLVNVLQIQHQTVIVLMNLAVQAVLLIVGFIVQKHWVFKKT